MRPTYTSTATQTEEWTDPFKADDAKQPPPTQSTSKPGKALQASTGGALAGLQTRSRSSTGTGASPSSSANPVASTGTPSSRGVPTRRPIGSPSAVAGKSQANPSLPQGGQGRVAALIHQFEAKTSSTPPAAPKQARLKEPAPRQYVDKGTSIAMHDIHNHSIGPGYAPSQIRDMTKTLAQNARDQSVLFDDAGVDRFVWAPIPTVIVQGEAITCCGTEDHPVPEDRSMMLGKTYYMDQTHREGAAVNPDSFKKITTEGKQYYNTSVDYQVGKAYEELRRTDPELAKRISPAITGIHLGDANSVSAMLRLKMEYPGVFHIIGEITMHKEFVDKQNGSYTPRFDDKAPINDIFRFAARSGMPVVLHCDSSDAEESIRNQKPEEGTAPGKGEYFAGIRDIIARHPDTKFVHAHMGGVGKFSGPSPNHAAEVRRLIETYPNYQVDISWDVVAENYSPNSKVTGRPDLRAADEAMRRNRIQEMAKLMNEYPDRFIMGSDALVSHAPKSISATYGIYSNLGQGEGSLLNRDGSRKIALFDALHPDTLSKVLHGNFDKLLDKAKIDSEHYEQNGMKEDLAKMQAATTLLGRTPNDWGY